MSVNAVSWFAASPGAALATWQHCANGHEPVEWQARPSCFICDADGVKGRISDWRNTSTARFEASDGDC